MRPEAWDFWWVCAPVVVTGAPVGAWFIKNRSRHFVAGFFYLYMGVHYLAAMVIIPLTIGMAAFSLGVAAVGLLFFWGLARIGGQRLKLRNNGKAVGC